MTRKLQLHDIADLRAYERERDEFRSRVIALKQRRRVSLGTFVSVVFESRDTIRFQIQEMARVERLITDDEIRLELEVYNALVPEPGQLCASLFIELTSDDSMREWLPRLIGIERSLVLRLGDGTQVRAEPETRHAQQLIRDDVTSAVHYYVFSLSDAEIVALERHGAHLALDHPAYDEETELGASTVTELLADLR
jgi:hypothetical protein